MKTGEEISDHIAYLIGNIYDHGRPLMYGGDAAGVDSLLRTYHELWAFAVDRAADFQPAWAEELEAENCGSADFAHRYRMNHPEALEEEVAIYVMNHWRNVSERLQVPIPYARLKAEEEARRKWYEENCCG